MNVRFKMTDKGEVAILPRKDYEALAAKAQEADEDFGTAATRSRSEVACRKCESTTVPATASISSVEAKRSSS